LLCVFLAFPIEIFSRTQGYFVGNFTDGIKWQVNHVPSAGLGVRAAAVDSVSPYLAYDLRLWAAYNDNNAPGESGFKPNRPNNIPFTTVYFDVPEQGCTSASMMAWGDRPWNGDSSLIPAPAVMNGFHTAALRTLLELRGARSDATLSSPHIFASLVTFPSILWVSSVPGSDNPLQALFWPLFTLCLLPMMVFPIAHEKSEVRLRGNGRALKSNTPHFCPSFLAFACSHVDGRATICPVFLGPLRVQRFPLWHTLCALCCGQLCCRCQVNAQHWLATLSCFGNHVGACPGWLCHAYWFGATVTTQCFNVCVSGLWPFLQMVVPSPSSSPPLRSLTSVQAI